MLSIALFFSLSFKLESCFCINTWIFMMFWLTDMYVFWQFFLELMKVPRVESKLRVFSFKIQFHSQVRWLSILSFFHMLSVVVVLAVMSTLILYFFQVSDLRNNLNVVNSASEEVSYIFILRSLVSSKVFSVRLYLLHYFHNCAYQIRNSAKLKRIMQTILSLGNALNHGTARGELKFPW